MEYSISRLGLKAMFSSDSTKINNFLFEIQDIENFIPVPLEANDETILTLPVRFAIFAIKHNIKVSMPRAIKACARIFIYEQKQTTCRYRERILERIEFLEEKIRDYDLIAKKKKKLDKTFRPSDTEYWNKEILPLITDHLHLCRVLRIHKRNK